MTWYSTTPFNTEQYFHDHLTVYTVLNIDVLSWQLFSYSLRYVCGFQDTCIKIWSYFPQSFSWPLSDEGYFGGNQDNMLNMVETRTIQSDLNIDILPPLVVVFLQFKICMRFP